MSVIIESQPGDKLVCVESFSASPRGEPFSWQTSRTFRIGERVKYVTHYRDEHRMDQPTGWMVVVSAEDGKEYAATQTYFLTREAWRALERYFVNRTVRKLVGMPLRLLVLKPLRAIKKRLLSRKARPQSPPQLQPPQG
ncbi:MAG: hypothetical protein L0Z62_18845 [Gemmataceae bacterium]|nr:hypothetical protein [Gemmataceae bacterium]